jgi:hypothetical protein
MAYRRGPGRFRRTWEALKRLFQSGGDPGGDPDDPYALVGAPKKPRPPQRSAAAAAEPES